MAVKLLPLDLNERIRSDVAINNFSQCILELVFNSLDAKSTALSIRIDIAKYYVQVVDNGNGIALSDFHNVGIRYMTSKCDSLNSFESKHKYYGYKGESLTSIICASEKFLISSRYYDGDYTWNKIFVSGEFKSLVQVKQRSCRGTTVTIDGLFFNCPVKQRRIKKSIDLSNIKTMLERLSIIHPCITFSLRDDSTGTTLLNCCKTTTVSKSLCSLYGDLASENLIEVKVSKNNTHVSGLIYTKAYKNNKSQLIYVNKRPVHLENIQRYIKETLSNTLKGVITNELYPVFVINISCPYSEVDLLFESSNILAEFKSSNIVQKCVEKVINLFISKYKKINSPKTVLKDLSQRTNLKVNNEKKEFNDEQEYFRVSGDKNEDQSSKKFNKTLGLKKRRNSLKRLKHEFINDISKISSPNSVKISPKKFSLSKDTKKLKHFKSIFDDNFNSQHLLYNQKILSKPEYKNDISGDERKGKAFVMNLFMDSFLNSKSIQPTLGKKNSFDDCIKSKLNDGDDDDEEKIVTRKDNNFQQESFSGADVDLLPQNKNYSLRGSLLKNSITLNSSHETFIEDVEITKQPSQKSDNIKISLIEEKRTIKRKDSEDKGIQTCFSDDSKKFKNIGTSTTFVKRNSEDKSIQTYFINDDRIQASPDIYPKQLSLSQNVTVNSNDEFLNFCEEENKDTFSFLTPTTSKKSKMDDNYNQLTFLSHYDPKHQLKHNQISNELLRKTQNNTSVVQINTKDFLDDILDNVSCKRYDNVNHETYTKFKHGLQRKKSNFSSKSNSSFITSNFQDDLENDRNISKYFTNNQHGNKFQSTNNQGDINNRNINSVLINTSYFVGNQDEEDIEKSRFFNFAKPADVVYNDSMISFGKFIPGHKSTQKDAKYFGTDYNFFNSFAFNDFVNEQFEKKIGKNVPNFLKNDRAAEEWSQKIDGIGNHYFMNKRTGMTKHYNYTEKSKFLLKKRADFVPKGLSPILKDINMSHITLSPPSKKHLNNAIIESYENELDLIKWQEYIDKQDPKEFFDKLYEEKLKQIEQNIPNINNVFIRNIKKIYSPDESITFTKDIFSKLEILGQLDKKFIVTLYNSSLLVLLDQHAVHERIRVEQLLQDYTYHNQNSTDKIVFKSIKYNGSLTINLTIIELELLNAFQSHFENLGLYFDLYDSYIKIRRIPCCFMKKCTKDTDPQENLHKFISTLLLDEINILQTTRGVISNIPKIIQYVINSQACRGAIKFGRKLTKQECLEHITNLSKCQLPFQCAHGRPIMFPILEILRSDMDTSPWNLKIFRKL